MLTPSSSSFWVQICLYNNPSLWWNLRCDGNGTWIWEGICMGTLIIIHGGSYMKEISLLVSSATVMILCTNTGSMCKCMIAEKSSSAGSYRSKILGAILAQLTLHAAVQGRMGPYPIMMKDCNSLGVGQHKNKHHRSISTTQTHADVYEF
jgi:hypothetical protein